MEAQAERFAREVLRVARAQISLLISDLLKSLDLSSVAGCGRFYGKREVSSSGKPEEPSLTPPHGINPHAKKQNHQQLSGKEKYPYGLWG